MPVNLDLGTGIGGYPWRSGGGAPPAPNLAIQFTGEIKLAETFSAGADGERFVAMAWFKIDAVSVNQTILLFAHGTTRDQKVEVDNSDPDFNIDIDTGDNSNATGVPFPVGSWHHICMLFRQTVGLTRVFLDGDDIGTCNTGGIGLAAFDFAIGADDLDRLAGAVTSFKYGFMAGDITEAEVLAEMATRSAVLGALTAVSLNGSADLGIFTAVGTGSLSDVSGPGGL